DEAWDRFPFIISKQVFLAQADWWRATTIEVRGMAPNNAARVSFSALQFLNIFSPSNVPWLNPVVIDRTQREAGANLIRGWNNFFEDAICISLQIPNGRNGFVVEDVATTPGEVI